MCVTTYYNDKAENNVYQSWQYIHLQRGSHSASFELLCFLSLASVLSLYSFSLQTVMSHSMLFDHPLENRSLNNETNTILKGSKKNMHNLVI